MDITIIGNFGGWDKNSVCGQKIKTKNLYKLLCEKYIVNYIDTYKWNKNIFKLIREIRKSCKKTTTFIIMPDFNGLKVIPMLLLILKHKYKKIKIYYSVIGGWLPFYLKKRKSMRRIIKKLNGVWVETKTMEKELLKLNLENIKLINNFKLLNPVSENDLDNIYTKENHFVIFSRICQEKGITDAIKAIEVARNKTNMDIKLDIYGKIAEEYKNEFYQLIKNKQYIQYKGMIEENKSVNVLKNYFMLLFPTRFLGEGTPGTIIDAMYSALPVISSKWPVYEDIVHEKNALLYDFLNFNQLVEKIIWAVENPSIILNMKKNCLNECYKYSKENILLHISQSLSNQ